MGKRNSLNEYEVSIVKALLNTGKYTKQQIAGMINRYRGGAERDISSGRISNIEKNQTQKYMPTKAALPKTLNTFLEELNKQVVSNIDHSESPLNKHVIDSLLPIKSNSIDHLDIAETDQIECKQSFNTPMKTIAAFANNKGGYFALGIEDKTWKIIGLNNKKFEEFDLANLNKKIRSSLGIDLKIQKKVITKNKKKIGILYVAPAHTKPVIFLKDGNGFSQGHIYYRYPGEDRLIAPTDLQRIIEDRIKQLSETILTQQISKILSIGPANAAIMNTKTGQVDGPSGNFMIDEHLLSELTFIKEGEFDEKSGAPTLKVIGSLVSGDTKNVTIQLENLTNDDLIQNFLQQNIVTNPTAFIKRLAHTQTKWLPIYYYIKLAGLNKAKAIKILEAEKGSKNSINNQVSRLKKIQSFKAASKNANKDELINKAKTNQAYNLSTMTITKKRQLLYAIQKLNKPEVSKEYVLNLLKDFYDNEFPDADYGFQSLIRGAVSYIDMLLHE